jgi:tetratricopeptide (TPR) repeat protein
MVVVVLVGCGAPADPPADPAEQAESPVPQLVPLPEISGLDPQVQEQLRDAHAALLETGGAGTASGDQYGRMGMLFSAYGLSEAAEVSYLNARLLSPGEFRWVYYLALLYEETTQPERAIDSLERALELNPDYVAGLARLGDLLVGQDRSDEARQLFARALTLDDRCAQCLVGLGRIELQEQQFQRAAEHLERALAIAPWASTTRYPLALAYRGLGEDAKAEAQLQARADVALNTGIGQRIDKVGVPDALLEELRAVGIAGNVAFEARGAMAAREGRWTEALEEFNKMVAADPTNAVSRNVLATALLATGNRDEARTHYQEAVRLDPSHAGANLQLGIFLADDGLESDAIAHFRRAVQFDPGSNVAYLNLAAALLRSGEAEEAVEVYAALLQLDPSNAPARLGRAFALIRAGRHVEAKTRLLEDVQARPDEIAFPHALARLLAASPDASVRDGRRALELVQQVSKSLPGGQVAETMAMAMAELGLADQADRFQRMAIDLADKAGMTALSAQLRATLSLYERGLPSREPFRSDDPVFFPPPFSPQAAFESEPR